MTVWNTAWDSRQSLKLPPSLQVWHVKSTGLVFCNELMIIIHILQFEHFYYTCWEFFGKACVFSM